MNLEGTPTIDQIREIQLKLRDASWDHWLNHDAFTLRWWLLLLVLILPWIVWWKYVDKSRIFEITAFGFFLMILVTLLDSIGTHFGRWSYDYNLVPVLPLLFPVDYSIIVVSHMLIYQYFRSWKSFLAAETLMALVFSFIFEPVTEWLKIYIAYEWKHVYSFPIYVIKAAFGRWLIGCFMASKMRAEGKG